MTLYLHINTAEWVKFVNEQKMYEGMWTFIIKEPGEGNTSVYKHKFFESKKDGFELALSGLYEALVFIRDNYAPNLILVIRVDSEDLDAFLIKLKGHASVEWRVPLSQGIKDLKEKISNLLTAKDTIFSDWSYW